MRRRLILSAAPLVLAAVVLAGCATTPAPSASTSSRVTVPYSSPSRNQLIVSPSHSTA